MEFEKSNLVQKLRHGINMKYRTTKERTLTGKPKVVGKTSTLDTKKGNKIKKVLTPWIKTSDERGYLSKARAALSQAGLATADGNDFSLSQVKTWIEALRP